MSNNNRHHHHSVKQHTKEIWANSTKFEKGVIIYLVVVNHLIMFCFFGMLIYHFFF